MRNPRTKSGVRLAVALFAIAAFFALAGSAMAAPTQPNPSLAPPTVSPTNADSGNFAWTASDPTPADPTNPLDLGNTIVRYEGGIVGLPQVNFGVALAGTAPLPTTSGTYTFQVRAVEIPTGALAPETPGPYGTVPITIDRTGPTVIAVPAPAAPNGSGWYRSLVIDWQCSDGAACIPETKTVTAQGINLTETATAQDALGNPGSGSFGPFNFDSIDPPKSSLTSPSNATTVAAEPTFSWTESVDVDQNDVISNASGTDRYELWADWGNGDTKIATLDGPKHITAPPSEYDTLPQLKDIEWFVKAIDTAGNVSGESGHRKFRIDPSVPPGPTITNGPGGQTNDTTPAFAWSGAQPTFEWSVIPAGANSPVQQGSGASKQVTLGALAPGDYTFRVIQVSAAGVESEETTYPFTLDTSAPAPPVIDARPINGSKDITPSFSWRGETHATYTWKVIGAGGGVVRGDSTTDTSLTLAPLTPGPYTFQITQTDRAGNTSSAAVDPFSIIGPSGLLTGTKLSLPTTNHRRLKPRRGVTVPTRRPVLRWTPGPRGTTLYNVQLFRVTKRTTGKARVTKVFTTFPRALQYRVPAARTRPATCYVWRVWPYLGTRFTKRPLGISNFCIANKATLLKAAQRKAARAQAARAGTAAR